MKRFLVFVVMCGMVVAAHGQGMETWNVFAKTKFEPKFDEKLGEYLFYPTFPDDVKKLEG